MMMMVAVEILTGRWFNVRLGDGATVLDLKKEICVQDKQLPRDRLVLVMDGGGEEQCLMSDDGALLADYGVGDGSHVYLFFTLPPSATSHC
ncbi:unnamed protein product [Cuscuta campestris]|uniref:Ubiquitin-like domain-containing protein n=1 Tax=Cuscuta campestris TaxID=132261 RepID=A0A484NQX5_9ASTE|nr:unnamed protein product [Cuscuta campestris]